MPDDNTPHPWEGAGVGYPPVSEGKNKGTVSELGGDNIPTPGGSGGGGGPTIQRGLRGPPPHR